MRSGAPFSMRLPVHGCVDGALSLWQNASRFSRICNREMMQTAMRTGTFEE